MSTRLGRWGWLGPGARNGSKDVGFMAPPPSPLGTCRAAPGAAREAEAMRPGAARLQGWRRLAPPLPLALTMRHELMGFGGPRPWKPNTRGDSIGKCGLWDEIGGPYKRGPRGKSSSLSSVCRHREKRAVRHPEGGLRQTPTRLGLPVPGAASEKHLLFTSHSTCGDTLVATAR